MKSTNYIKLVFGFVFAASLWSCADDFLDTTPKDLVSIDQIERTAEVGDFTEITNANLTGMSAIMFDFGLGGNTSHDFFGQKSIDLSTDLTGQDHIQFQHHWFGFDYLMENRNSNYRRTNRNWNFYYTLIKSANELIKSIPADVSGAELRAHRGQALTYRAYAYHYLARIYQKTYLDNPSAPGVPLYNEDTSEASGRAPLTEVYAQIVSDLEAAVGYLDGYTRENKTQIDQSVAYAWLASAKLEMGDYAGAVSAAKAARAGYSLMNEAQWLSGFNDISNPEWMWASDVDAETTTLYASFFSHMANTSPGYAGLLGIYKNIDRSLYDMISDTDYRKKAFVGASGSASFPPYANLKFQDPTFFEADYVYLRASEMYLIEAEAAAKMGDEATAKAALTALAGARDSEFSADGLSGASLLAAIQTHRRIELWGEGRSFFDFKRWGWGVDRTYAGNNHRQDARFKFEAGDKIFTYQIPDKEFETNSALQPSDQNP